MTLPEFKVEPQMPIFYQLDVLPLWGARGPSAAIPLASRYCLQHKRHDHSTAFLPGGANCASWIER
jgi:hypothetical protein